MSKSHIAAAPVAAALLAGLATGGATARASAAPLGPYAAQCAGGHPAMLVVVSGLKSRSGTVRVQSYGGDPQAWFAKGTYLQRVELQPPAAGPVEVCLPVPGPGTYAVSVRHDVNGSGKADRADGGGTSGNPDFSLLDVMFKRRPSPAQVAVKVAGLTRVPVTLNYIQGTSVRPFGQER